MDFVLCHIRTPIITSQRPARNLHPPPPAHGLQAKKTVKGHEDRIVPVAQVFLLQGGGQGVGVPNPSLRLLPRRLSFYTVNC